MVLNSESDSTDCHLVFLELANSTKPSIKTFLCPEVKFLEAQCSYDP